MNDQQNNTYNRIIGAALIFLLFLFLLRFMGRLIPFILGIALVLGVAAVPFLLWKYFQKRREEKQHRETMENLSSEKMRYCQEQIKKNEREAEEIRESIQQLRKQLGQGEGLATRTREEALRLIREFEAELQLRQSKVSFFETALRKLGNLQRNRLLSQTIEDKELELKRLKENRYEDLADMEELRTEMELETLYLDTIEELSLKMNNSTSLENAESLRQELEEMTRGLEE